MNSTPQLLLAASAFVFSSLLANGADSFANAELLANNSTTVVNASSATKEAGEPSTVLFRSNWFRYVAPSRGIVRINIPATSTSSLDPGIHVFRGAAIDKLNKVKNTAFTNAGVTVTFPAEAGMEFRIATSQDSSANYGNYNLVIQMDAWPYGSPSDSLVTPDMPTSQLVSNDELANAKALPSTTSTYMVMEYIGSATSGNIGPEPGATGNSTVWYKWTAPQRGVATFVAASGLGFTPIISAYRGASISAITMVNRGVGSINFPVEQGFEYKICVGVSSGITPNPLLFTISNSVWPFGAVSLVVPPLPTTSIPVNDYYDTARALPSQLGSFGVLDYNLSATSASDEIQAGLGFKSLWYKWTAPEDAFVTLASLSSTYITYSHALSVWTPNGVVAFDFVARGYNEGEAPTAAPATCKFLARKGITYQIGFTTGSELVGGPLYFTLQATKRQNLGGPIAKIASPKSKAVVSKKGFLIKYTLSPDPEGIGKVRVRLNGKVKFFGNLAKGSNLSNLRYIVPAMKPGQLKVQIDAQDSEGKWGAVALRYYKVK